MMKAVLLFFAAIQIGVAQSYSFESDDWILFPRIRCSIAMLRNGFKVEDFDNYPKVFASDSVMELAQTGQYIGPSNIEEYVRFLHATSSPYLTCCDAPLSFEIKFLGYKNGQCELLHVSTAMYEFDPSAAKNSGSYKGGAALKLYLNLKTRQISRINVFFTDDFLRIFFDAFLNSDPTRNYVCDVMEGPCSTILNTNKSINGSDVSITNNKVSSCESMLTALPVSEGAAYYVDGKSQGCRALHAAFAEKKPEQHCAHLSFEPMADPKGSIKCQSTKLTSPATLFTERELSIFKQYIASKGLDPILGHDSAL